MAATAIGHYRFTTDVRDSFGDSKLQCYVTVSHISFRPPKIIMS